MVALSRLIGFLLLALLLVCAWTRPPAYTTGSSSAQAPSARHVQAAKEGETPKPIADQQLALKKRRGQSNAPAQSFAHVPESNGATVFTTADSDLHQLDRAAEQASQRYALASRLRLRDPAIRLHPGHAPPQAAAG